MQILNDPALSILRIRIKAAMQQAKACQISAGDIRRILDECQDEVGMCPEPSQGTRSKVLSENY